MGDSLPRTIAEMYLGDCDKYEDRTALVYEAAAVDTKEGQTR